MIKIGYFCTGGKTETGGIQFFLDKINHANIKFVRCFPAVGKPNLKIGRMNSTPISNHNGITGISLIKNMLENIKKYCVDEDYAGFLVIDDMDCRFYGWSDESIKKWIYDIKKQIVDIFKKEIYFNILFAAPEVEAWLISDWTRSFDLEYPKEISYRLQETLKKNILLNYWESGIETYGGRYINGGCENKLSQKIIDVFYQIGLSADGKIYEYSKDDNGGEMLKRINPDEVAKKCNKYYAPVYNELINMK